MNAGPIIAEKGRGTTLGIWPTQSHRSRRKAVSPKLHNASFRHGESSIRATRLLCGPNQGHVVLMDECLHRLERLQECVDLRRVFLDD